jgi:hypothetical protein
MLLQRTTQIAQHHHQLTYILNLLLMLLLLIVKHLYLTVQFRISATTIREVPSLKNKQKYVFRHHDDGGYFHGLYYNPLPPDHKVRKRMAGATDKDGDVPIFEITLNDIVNKVV